MKANSDLVNIILILIIFALIISCILIPPLFFGKYKCDQLQKLNEDYKFYWNPSAGCLVNIDGFWVDTDNVGAGQPYDYIQVPDWE